YRLQDTPLSLDEAIASVAGPDAGGMVTFVGNVRRESGGRQVLRMEYEAYREMAEAKLRRIGEDLERNHGARLAILHRVGTLEVGETAVIIVAAAAHRAEAFAACRKPSSGSRWKCQSGRRSLAKTAPSGLEWVLNISYLATSAGRSGWVTSAG